MKEYVYDAGALALLMAGDIRLKSYVAEATRGDAASHVSSVDLAEFYYKTGEKLGIETAETWFLRIVNSDIHVQDADKNLARDAGLNKIRYRGRLSLADCYAAAETAKRKAVLLTTDKDLAQVKEIEASYFKV
jgi:predicted nucleic acid-binding protein